MTTTSWIDPILRELRVGEEHAEVLRRLLACAGARGADVAQEFAFRLLEAREAALPEPESIALAAARRFLRRARIDDSILAPLVIETDGQERERALAPLPLPIPASRRQIRWGRRDEAERKRATLKKGAKTPVVANLRQRAQSGKSSEIAARMVAREADLAEAVRGLPLPERRAVDALYGITGPARRGRRSLELLALAERAVERLRENLAPEQIAANLF